MEQLLKQYGRHELERIDWLDHLTFAEVDHIRQQVRNCPNEEPWAFLGPMPCGINLLTFQFGCPQWQVAAI